MGDKNGIRKRMRCLPNPSLNQWMVPPNNKHFV